MPATQWMVVPVIWRTKRFRLTGRLIINSSISAHRVLLREERELPVGNKFVPYELSPGLKICGLCQWESVGMLRLRRSQF